MTEYEKFASEEEVPVIMVDTEGLITYINKSFEETFNWPSVELIGQPLITVIPPYLHDAHNMGFSKYIITRSPTLLNTPVELEIKKGNGEIQPAHHYIVALENKGETVMAAKITLRDK